MTFKKLKRSGLVGLAAGNEGWSIASRIPFAKLGEGMGN
jgi:hypothetical protein